MVAFWRTPRVQITRGLKGLRAVLAPALPIAVATHEAVLSRAASRGFAFYDALIVAAALEARCDTLLTKELHDDRVIGGRLTIGSSFVGL